MSDYYDELEIRSADAREHALMQALSAQVAHAKANATAATVSLAAIDAAAVNSRAALAQLPVTRKSELVERQRTQPPFGGYSATGLANLERVFASPGPIFEPQGQRADYWRVARSMYAAGLRQGQLVHNTFSYHFTPAGMMLESGAQALGCPVFPAGIGQTELQVQAMAHLQPLFYSGTPSCLNIILDKAAQMGSDVSSLSQGLVGGEALPPSLRSTLADRGVAVLQCYATADVGLIAYESKAMEGMIIDEGVIVEIVRPGTGEPVADGEVGEVLVTTFCPDYPLIRFATGDMSAILSGQSPCGRTNSRIKGWMGRADQTTKIRGMFVHPASVAEVLKRHPELGKGRLVVTSKDNQDVCVLYCEVAGSGNEALSVQVAATFRDVCKLRGDVQFAELGALANDGKVIDDVRSYE